jgi:uncharacterized membrane-anchored protein YitT (DUF2179 family)
MMKIGIHAGIAFLILVGLSVSKSWRFNPSECGKTFQDAHGFDQKLWMVIDTFVLIGLCALIYLSYKDDKKHEMIFYVATLAVFVSMKVRHMQNADKINKGDCAARIEDVWFGTLVDGWLLGMSVLYIAQAVPTMKQGFFSALY